jgi:hypothetical protein
MTFSKLGIDTDTGQLVYLPKAARTAGLYIIGLQGTGKSVLIENLIVEDIRQGIGVCVIDPHGGELVDKVIPRLPMNREKDVVLLDIADEDYPFGLNLFECPNLNSPKAVAKTVDKVMHVFDKLLEVSYDTPLIREYLLNCTYTLVANPGYTMADIPFLFENDQCRRKLVAQVTNDSVKSFWRRYERLKPDEQEKNFDPLRRRVQEFLQEMTRPIVGQRRTTIDLQEIMNEQKILLLKLEPDMQQVTTLIGSLFIALLLNAAYARPKNKRRQFHLYADEFERYATEDFAELLEQARKYGIATTIAHQNRGQLNSANSKLETNLKDRSRSTRNKVVFEINGKDAEDLASEFDHSPRPGGETRLENITETVYDEWDEDVWDSEELKAEYLAIPEKIAALKHTMFTLARAVGVYTEQKVLGSGNTKVTTEILKPYYWDEFEKALSMTPEQYAREMKRKHPVFLLLPDTNNQDKQLITYLLEHVYSYPVGIDSEMGDIKSTKELIETLDTKPDWSNNTYLDYVKTQVRSRLFTYPLRNRRAETFSLPSNIPSRIELDLQRAWWQQAKKYPRTRGDLDDEERSKRLERELLFDKRVILSEALLRELQEVVTPIKEQVIYTYNPAFRVKTSTKTVPEYYEPNTVWWRHHGKPWRPVGKKRITERKIEYVMPIEERMSKWGEVWDINFEVLMPVLEWIHQRILSCMEEIDTLGIRRIDLWHEHRRTVHHKVPLHERTVYDYIGIGSKYRDYDQAMPKQRRVPTEISSSEVLNRVGNELSHPKQEYTARVRIAVNIPENPGKKCFKCGFPNIYGAVLCGECETPLPAPNEYTIKTLEPEETYDHKKEPEKKPLFGQKLQLRIERILEQNRSNGYTRLRAEVEEEITQRQIGCSGGSSPAQQKQLPRRVARQVPVQEICSNCGAANQPGSKFCNQCGEKI